MALRKLAVSRVRTCPRDPAVKCPLAGNGYVPGVGPEATEYAIVGEAPAFNEVRAGVPFVGPAGRILNGALRLAEVNRAQIYVTNAVKCRFPAGLTTNEKKTCTERCAKGMVKELTERGVKYVLAMGNFAMCSLGYSHKGITKSRGRVVEHPAGFRVMPCVHPAAILHGGAFVGPEVESNLIGDVKRWAAECADHRVKIFDNFDVIKDSRQGILFLRDVAKRTRAVIDTETSGYSITYDGFLCAVISLGPEHATILTDDVLYDENFINSLKQLTNLYWIGHNLSFDLLRVRKWLGVELEPGFDTMLAHYCLAPTTRALKTDLTWVEVQSLSAGDELVGFDESDPQQMLPSTVRAAKRQTAPAYKITTARGSVTCSAKHLWPCKINQQGSTRWRTTEEMFRRRGTTSLMHFVSPWEVDTSYEAGYIAGILDGEGSLAGRTLCFSQKPNRVLSTSVKYLGAKEFDLNLTESRTVIKAQFKGSRETLRAIGTFRPARFLERVDELLFGGWGEGGLQGIGRRKQHPEPITNIEYLGEREVIGVETTTGTFIAEGFLTHNCLTEERGTHGLKILAANLLDAPDWEADIKKHGDPKESFLMLPKPILWKYCANDGVFNYRLYEVLWELLNKPENSGPLKLFNTIMMPGTKALMAFEDNGIFIDPDRLQRLWKEFEAEAEAAADALRILVKKSLREELGPIYGPKYKTWGKKKQDAFDRKIVRVRTEFNPNSPQQLGYILYNRLKAPPYSQSGKEDAEAVQLVAPTGRIPEYCTRKEQLERLTKWVELPEVKRFAEALIAYRSPKHSISHYLRPFSEYVEDDGRVHPSYLLHSSVTGRLSSRDPNVMNMERDTGVRKAPSPEPGNVIIIPDYSQAEFRVMAMLSGDESLKQYYRDGGDVHDMTTTWFYGPDYTDTHRVIGKGFNFGVLYGRGAKSIALGFGIPLYEAQQKMHMLFEVMPELPNFIARVRHEVLTKGYIETPLGRRRRFPGATPQNYGSIQRFAINSPIQGTSSDILFLATMDILKWAPDYSTRVLFPLHDSLPIETPIETMREVALKTIWDMWQSPKRVFGPDCIPFKVDMLYGDSLHKSDLQKLEYTDEEVYELCA